LIEVEKAARERATHVPERLNALIAKEKAGDLSGHLFRIMDEEPHFEAFTADEISKLMTLSSSATL
jgi:hypothetical protein